MVFIYFQNMITTTQKQIFARHPVKKFKASLGNETYMYMRPYCLQIWHGRRFWPARFAFSSLFKDPIDLHPVLMFPLRRKTPSVSTSKEISRIPGNPDLFRLIFGKWKNSWKCEHFNKSWVDTCTCTTDSQVTTPCSNLQCILRAWNKTIARK